MEILIELKQDLCEEETHLLVTVANLYGYVETSWFLKESFQAPTSLVQTTRDQMEAFDKATLRTTDPRPRTSAQDVVK